MGILREPYLKNGITYHAEISCENTTLLVIHTTKVSYQNIGSFSFYDSYNMSKTSHFRHFESFMTHDKEQHQDMKFLS